jgi:hypothetical protein
MNKKVTKKSAPKKVAKKVVKKAATKKVVKKTAKKPATKKAKSIKTIQALREGFKAGSKKNPLPHIKYLNCAISDVSNEKFPEMVQITMGPAKIMDDLSGRRYVNLEYAKIAIDEIHGFNIVAKGLTKVADELADLGIAAVEVVDRNPFNALLVTK